MFHVCSEEFGAVSLNLNCSEEEGIDYSVEPSLLLERNPRLKNRVAYTVLSLQELLTIEQTRSTTLPQKVKEIENRKVFHAVTYSPQATNMSPDHTQTPLENWLYIWLCMKYVRVSGGTGVADT